MFPWLPEGAKRAEFVRLRTVGAFLVTANWSSSAISSSGRSKTADVGTGGGGGVVASPVVLSSEAGGQCELELFEGWTTAELSVCSLSHSGGSSGKKIAVTEGRDDEGRVLWSFETVKGTEYSLRRGQQTTCP